MSDEESQFVVPPSFIALFVPPGRIKPTESRAEIARRYDFCEDLAQMLVDVAAARQVERDATAGEVLIPIHRGLVEGTVCETPAEAEWVVRRLAELLGWKNPELPGAPPANT